MTPEQIKPCPFCGNIPELIKRGNEHTKKVSTEIYCKNCNVLMVVGAIRNNLKWCEEKVIEKWNKRFNPLT